MLSSGDDRIELRYFGRGHTNGDAWVIFPALRVVHAGDIFARKGLLFLDGTNGGSGVEVPDTLAKAAEALTNIEAINHRAQLGDDRRRSQGVHRVQP